MRILRLELVGFGPFRERQIVDFAAAAAGGILLISGPTGSGKSSLLDAVSFALYDTVPRYEGQSWHVRSDHAEETQQTVVTLDFEMGGERFRVVRSPKYQRPSRRKRGAVTKQPSEARLWRLNEETGEWEGLASRPTDVAAELSQIIGLGHRQFLQVVLLAQGGFQRFLHAGDEDRQATLRSLFMTRRFGTVERLLAERRKELGGRVDRARAHLEGLLEQVEAQVRADDGTPDSTGSAVGGAVDGKGAAVPVSTDARLAAVSASVECLQERLRELRAEAERTAAARGEADAVAQRSRRIAEAGERLALARAEREELEEAGKRIAGAADRLAGAERAERVAEPLRRRDQAAERLAALEADLAQATENLGAARGAAVAKGNRAVAGDAEETAAGLAAERDRITASLALLDEKRKREDGLPGLAAETDAAASDLAAARSRLDAHRQRVAELPGLRDRTRDERDAAAQVTATLVERSEALQRTRTQLAAAEQVAAIEPRLRAARVQSAEAAGRQAEAGVALRELLQRRLDGMAGELAGKLIDGEPCFVCGSTAHPEPAPHDDPVDDDSVAEAERVVNEAQQRYERARQHERDIETERTEAAALAGGLDAKAAAAALRDAEAAHREAETAAADRTRLETRLTELEVEVERAAETEQELRAAVLRAEQHALAAEQQLTALREAVDEGRGSFPSVAARLEAERALRAALVRTHELRAARPETSAAALEARGELDEALATHGFADAAAAREAALTADERATLREQIDAHREAVQRNDGALADPALRDLPEEPVPLAEHEAALAGATEAAAVALTTAVRVEDRLRERREHLERLESAVAAAAGEVEELLTLRRLADTVVGQEPNTRRMRLEVFVLAARLEAIVQAANRRLERMVGGRYTLEHDDGLRAHRRQSGLGLRVMDEYTGRARSAESLSGGETFLVSLALALGLADVVTAEAGGITLDTLFIDEGFGSLDPDSLDQAMAMLDSLREGGRTVAVISHVAEMKERLPAGLEVVVDGRGTSRLLGAGVPDGDTDSSADEQKRITA